MSGLVPVFDGHNDVLLRLVRRGGPDPVRAFLDGDGQGQLDLPRMAVGGFAGGFFAMFTPSPGRQGGFSTPAAGAYEEPVAPEVDQPTALTATVAMAALLFRIERASEGRLRVVRSAGELRAAIAAGAVAAIFHIEGAEAIDPDFAALDLLFAAGLRSLGPVWSRSNIYGHGVPFRYPSAGDIGPGLTDLGKDLVRACNRRRILVDLSHLNEQGFWDVAAITDAPLVATHSNAHAVSPHARNLTDRQLDAIRESKGMVGVVYANAFLRPDGRRGGDVPLDVVVDHVDHLVGRLGIEGVGLGSDFDGAAVPDDIKDVAGLPNLVEALRRRGYDGEALDRITHRNWIELLDRTWGG